MRSDEALAKYLDRIGDALIALESRITVLEQNVEQMTGLHETQASILKGLTQVVASDHS